MKIYKVIRTTEYSNGNKAAEKIEHYKSKQQAVTEVEKTMVFQGDNLYIGEWQENELACLFDETFPEKSREIARIHEVEVK